MHGCHVARAAAVWLLRRLESAHSDYARTSRDMPSLPKQVLFVRHGQGVHNLEGGDKESPDPAVRQTNRQPAMHSPQPACLLTE